MIENVKVEKIMFLDYVIVNGYMIVLFINYGMGEYRLVLEF